MTAAIALVLIGAIALWQVIGILLTVFVFSQFPFVDGGWHFIVLWPVVLFTCMGWIPPVILLTFYGAVIWGAVRLTI